MDVFSDAARRDQEVETRRNVRNRLDTIYAKATEESELRNLGNSPNTHKELPALRTTFRVYISGKKNPLVYELGREDDIEPSSYPPDPKWGAPGPMPTIPIRKPEFIVLTDETQESYFLPLGLDVGRQ